MTREQRFVLAGLGAILLITAAWWALALWPAPAEGAEWLLRTRYVCFGSTGTGLPDGAGWALLVGQPLGMTLVLVAGWRHATASALRRVAGSRVGRLALGGVALGLLVGAGAATARVADAASSSRVLLEAPPGAPAGHPRVDRPAPSSLALADHRGRPFALDSVRGRPALVTFAFAHCETICPVLVREVMEAARLAGERGGTAPAVVVLTVDPWRDTPARLPHVARAWSLPPDAYLLGGEPVVVTAELAAWEVPIRRDELTGNVTHPALVYVLDRDGRIRFTATGGGAYLAALVARL